MLSLRTIISRCFAGLYHSQYRGNAFLWQERKSRYLTIPFDTEEIELPLFVINALHTSIYSKGNNINLDSDNLVVAMHTSSKCGEYTTMDANIRQIIGASFTNSLMKITLKDSSTVYYGTYGALFDKDLNPLMMLIWKVKRTPPDNLEEGSREWFTPIRPIIRVSPRIALKENSMERYIFNKIITEGLALTNLEGISSAIFHYLPQKTFSTQVIIDEFPFLISDPAIPSISTTNKELIDTALTYIDDMD